MWLVDTGQRGIYMLLLIVMLAFTALSEMRSEGFVKNLAKSWQKSQIDGMRSTLKEKEKSVLSVRGRPTFQRDRLRRIQATQREFLDEITRLEIGDDPVQHELIDQTVRAFSRYYELLQKEQRVAGLLESINRSEIESDIERLERQADASSREARDQYLRAAEFRKQELRSLERAEQLSSLLQAHMDALESALSTMRTRMINNTVWDSATVSNVYSDLTQELLALERAYLEVTALEQDTVLEMERYE